VPLTSSLYVPGRLVDVENVLIDVGTGYYVQKVRPYLLLRWIFCSLCSTRQTRAQAVKHYEVKIEYIKANLDALQETMQKKQDNMSYLVNVIQSKLQSRAPQDNDKP
jgi:prefoldin alpha subunit